MIREFLNARETPVVSEVLLVRDGGRCFRPCILHAARDAGSAVRRLRGSGAHTHDVYHVVLYQGGDGCFCFAGREVPVRPRVLALASPGEVHDFLGWGTRPVVYSEVTFALIDDAGEPLLIPFAALLERLIGRSVTVPPAPQPVAAWCAEELVRRLDSLLHWALGASVDADAEAVHVLSGMLLFVAGNCGVKREADREAGALELCRRHLDRHFNENVPVAALARMAGVSVSHFHRRFRAAFGVSPNAYQQQLRLGAARNLLRLSDLRCKEIADRTGLGDAARFSRLFRRHVGVSPGAFRARCRGSEGAGRA